MKSIRDTVRSESAMPSGRPGEARLRGGRSRRALGGLSSHVPTASGFLYLSVVVDAFSRAVVAQKFLRMEDGLAPAHRVGALRNGDGTRPARTRGRDPPLGSRLARAPPWPSASAASVLACAPQPTPPAMTTRYSRTIVRRRELLRDARMRTDPGREQFGSHAPGAHGDLLLHRRVVQPAAQALRPRLPRPPGLRKTTPRPACSRKLLTVHEDGATPTPVPPVRRAGAHEGAAGGRGQVGPALRNEVQRPATSTRAHPGKTRTWKASTASFETNCSGAFVVARSSVHKRLAKSVEVDAVLPSVRFGTDTLSDAVENVLCLLRRIEQPLAREGFQSHPSAEASVAVRVVVKVARMVSSSKGA